MALCALSAVLIGSCGRSPRTFDLTAPRRPEPVLTAVSAPRAALPAPLAAAAGAWAFHRAAAEQLWAGTILWNDAIAAAEVAARTIPTRPEAVASAAVYAEGDRCGGTLPPCSVKERESGGDYGAVNPTGCGGYTCGGAWQFDPRTWNGYGGYEFAQDAPPDVQDAKARELWAGGAGASHWGV